jgi:DNA-binding response OmpR family regulator
MVEKKILIADDEEDIVNVLEKKFQASGYSVRTALKGRDAVEICKKDKPDLVLLDIVMPDMDGYSVAMALRGTNLLIDVPIIFMTGKELEQSGIEKRISELNAYDFITKPCSFEDLLAKIKEIIG